MSTRAFEDGPDSLFPTFASRGMPIGMKHEPKWKSRALAIEFWLATALVGGSFVAGLIAAIRSLLGD